jgi:hypothetical protein
MNRWLDARVVSTMYSGIVYGNLVANAAATVVATFRLGPGHGESRVRGYPIARTTIALNVQAKIRGCAGWRKRYVLMNRAAMEATGNYKSLVVPTSA